MADIARYEDIHFVDSTKPVWNYSFFTDGDVESFRAGTHYALYEKFGSHALKVLETDGFYFAVWAPNATRVAVVGDFNNWNTQSHTLFVRLDESGIWEGFIPGIQEYANYKYFIEGFEGAQLYKGDPFARHWELRPATSSKTKTIHYEWRDEGWMQNRKRPNSLKAPISVYELQLASWMKPDGNRADSFHTYRSVASHLIPYLQKMGFTHVEFMPVMEYPYDASWGYQVTGYFAPSSRFGIPEDLMYLIDELHLAGIGVFLDWVPSHYPGDGHGLYMFDGSHVYEYEDPKKGFHPDWNSYIFNYERGEVISFLMSNARYWFDLYHIDGMRVDAVSSMLQLDYSRGEGEWEPNIHGGNGNLEAIAFIKNLNQTIYRDFKNIQMIAEESTDWPGVTRMTSEDGLGFGMKWMMGWMHDTLDYFAIDPYFRDQHQDKFTFSMMYFYNENFMLPLSHDEVVHGKSPMLYKMPGDEWQKFANLRVLYTYMYTHPGAKMLFMGNEFGQTTEWNFEKEIDWHLLQYDPHVKLRDCVAALNWMYRNEPALHQLQFDQRGFEWVNLEHRDECVVVYKRRGLKRADDLLIVLNLTPVEKLNWKFVAKGKENWQQIFCSNDEQYWGTGKFCDQPVNVIPVDKRKRLYELELNLPGLSALVLK